MNKFKLPCLIAIFTLPLVLGGCGDEEPTIDQQIALQKLENERVIELARIKAEQNVGLAQAKSQTTVTSQPQVIYSEPLQERTSLASYEQDVSSGYDGSTVAVGVLGGAIAGYYASELLDGGWSSGYDYEGNTVYRDSNNRVVDNAKYSQYKASHKVKKSENAKKRKKRLAKLIAKSKKKAKAAKAKAKVLGKKAVEKTKPVLKKTKDNLVAASKNTAQKAKKAAKKVKRKKNKKRKK